MAQIGIKLAFSFFFAANYGTFKCTQKTKYMLAKEKYPYNLKITSTKTSLKDTSLMLPNMSNCVEPEILEGIKPETVLLYDF